jgi:hypothetical protein
MARLCRQLNTEPTVTRFVWALWLEIAVRQPSKSTEARNAISCPCLLNRCCLSFLGIVAVADGCALSFWSEIAAHVR